MSDRIKIFASITFLMGGAVVFVLSLTERHWPVVALLGYNAFIAYALFLGALFAAYHLPFRDRGFAIFLILAAASALAAGVLNLLPSGSMHQVVVNVLTVCLFVALMVHSFAWGACGLISGIVAFWNKPAPKLNGWQRLGIVVSIMWVLGMWAYAGSGIGIFNAAAHVVLGWFLAYLIIATIGWIADGFRPPR